MTGTGGVVLLLGSNAGRRVLRIRRGVEAIRGEIAVARVSRIYASAPKGRDGQPWFLNLAVSGTTELSPQELLRFVKAVESGAGRKAGPRWGPRELDVDIILMGDRVVNTADLVIPHREIAARRFCLVAVAEVAPEAVVPPGGKTVRELLDECRDPMEVVPI